MADIAAMTPELQLQSSLNEPDLLVCTGSRMYGTARYNEQGECISDQDLRGVVLPPLPYLIGLRSFDEQKCTQSEDHKVFSLQKFLQMLLSGNFQCLEMLFVPREHLLRLSEIGEGLFALRDLFISKVYYKSITGYSYSEWNKVRGVKLVPTKKTDKQKTAWDSLRNAFKHPNDIWDQIESLLYCGHQYELVDAKNDVGEKRRLEYSKYGYCATCAHHALRTLYECEELMRTKHMTFPRPERELLSKVKRGEPTLGEIEAMYSHISERAATAYESSNLPDRPDTTAVWKWYEDILIQRVKESVA